MTTNIHVDFRLDGNSASFGMSGFAEPEKIGTWMIGDTSTLSLPLPTSDSGPRSDEKRRFDISFSVIPELVPGIVETQRLQIIVNDRLALDARIGGPAELQCVIDNDSIGVSSNVEVKFKHPDGIRPLDHGRRDARVLSICLSSLSMREHDDPPADNDNAGSSLPVFDDELLASDLKSIGCRTEVPFPVFGERPVWRSLRSTESPTPLRPLAVENTVWTDEWVISMHRKGSPTIPVQISAYFLRDALVFGHGYVAVRGVLVTCPDVMPAYVKSGIKNGSYDLSSFAKLPLRTIEEPCIVYAGWGVSIYGHVLIEFIPKLHILLSANVLGETRPRLLVQDDIPEWHLAMLSVQFGLTREDFIFFEPQAERILLHQAIVPTLLSRPDGFLPATQDSILAGITLRHYVSAHASVSADLDAGRARDAFAHVLAFGQTDDLEPTAIADSQQEERVAKALFRRKARNLLPLFARHPLDFTFTGSPDVSVIVVLHNNFDLTMQALNSLRHSFPGAIELILIDSGSGDQTRFIGRTVHGAQLVRFDSNIGFVRAANAGVACSTAPVVLFLNNDLELGPDAVVLAVKRLLSDPRIGAVGGKIMRTHGRLHEAGGIIWRDGATLGYMRDASPSAPEANFVRDVDFCSGAFLLVRADLLKQLNGFLDEYAPAWYEDADLCARISRAGFRVVYDPSVVVHHYGYANAAAVGAAQAQSDRSRSVFVRENRHYLRSRYIADQRTTIFARSALVERHILFIEDQVPLRTWGSGFVRSNDVLTVMASLGFRVTVFPMFSSSSDVAAIYADIPETVEVMYDRSLEDLSEFLDSRDGYYETIWVARTHNLDRIRPIVERHVVGKGRPPRIILDTEAVASLRLAARADLLGQTFDLEAAAATELQNASFCQDIIAVSPSEARYLRSLGFSDVSLLGHIRELALTPKDFAERHGLLFVGATHDVGSPNYDGLCWFVDEVLPAVEQELGYETRLTIVGTTAKGVTFERFEHHPRVTLKGELADIGSLYNAHRVFIAPTRFAAGAPYKVYEAASFGLPVVATDLLCNQMEWTSGSDMLCSGVSDPARFAAHIVKLYRDAELWQRIRANAAARIRAENGRDQYVRALQAVL